MTTTEKVCISCGMPLRKPEDYPLGDESKNYCVYCAKEDGSMRSYEETKQGMTEFIIKTQGLSPDAAEEAALGLMKKQIAWKGQA